MHTEKERIKELINILNKASDKYYNAAKPTMSDKAWDNLFDELKLLEEETGIIFSNSPTQKIGYEVRSSLNKVTHSIPLKSLGKTKQIEDIEKMINNAETLFMLKGDGLTCELIYNNGYLLQGSTRGNGIIGEDITHNVKTFKNIPLKIDFKGYLKLAGEAVIVDNDFEQINSTLLIEEKYSNSRNLVSGTVRQLNSAICNKRNVKFLAFSLLECKDNNIEKTFQTVYEQFTFLNNFGFSIIPHVLFSNDKAIIEPTINQLREFAKIKGIPIDGIVVKYNNIAYGKSLGETEHHPNNAIAFKFYNEEYETRYIKTEWQVSRTGMLNPVAVFEPVDLDGAITTKATLHNVDYFNNLQLGKGDIITISRMNEVIPKVLDNKTRSNTEKIPERCPICGKKTEITKMKTAKILICTNENCPSKQVAAIEHFCSRNAMNIVGLSEATIEKFIDKGFIKNIPDIYKLNKYKNEIIDMEGFGIKSYNNLINSIDTSRHCNLNNFLYALGIPRVGKKTAKDLANHFKTIECLVANLAVNLIDNYDLTIIEDIGEITNNEILNWWSELSNKELVAELLKHIEIGVSKQHSVSTGIFSGMKIYATGTFANYKKEEIKKVIEANGGIFANGYAKSLSALVVGSLKGSTKVDTARGDNVKVILEEEFIAMIKQ